MEPVIRAAFMIFLFAFAVVCLFFPSRVHAIAIRRMEGKDFYRLVLNFVRSAAYIWNVRLVGAIALLMALLLAYSFRQSPSP